MIKEKLKYIKPWQRTVLFMLCFTVFLILAGRLSFMLPGKDNSLFFGIFGSAGGIFTLWLFKKAEDTSWAALGFAWTSRTVPGFLLGVLIGAAAFSIVFIPLLIATPLEITAQQVNFSMGTLLSLLPILPLALMEEIGFRSYPLFTLGRAYGTWVSQLVMAFTFACYHILYGWNIQVAFTGPFVWAMLFGLAALRSKGIAIPTGIHFSLNVLQAICGLKGDQPAAIWKLGYQHGVSQSEVQRTETFGLLLHGMMFILFLLLTYNHVKRTSKH